MQTVEIVGDEWRDAQVTMPTIALLTLLRCVKTALDAERAQSAKDHQPTEWYDAKLAEVAALDKDIRQQSDASGLAREGRDATGRFLGGDGRDADRVGQQTQPQRRAVMSAVNIFRVGPVLDPMIEVHGVCAVCEGGGSINTVACGQCGGSGQASATMRLSEIVPALGPAASLVGPQEEGVR